MFEKKDIVVIGAGTMGHSIVQVFAMKGYSVTLVDQSDEQLECAREMIANNVAGLIKMGEVAQIHADRIQSLITFSKKLDTAAPTARLVIESIVEDPFAKKELYAELDELCTAKCIFASNTSALNIFNIAEISHPERLIIAHWFNPPHIMPLVEVVLGPQTSLETRETVLNLLLELDKKPAVIKQYIPGFIINRMSIALAREAGYMVEQGWTTPEDIDSAIVSTFGPRYAFEGPIELFDYVGWDVVQAVADFLYPQICSTNQGGNPIADQLVSQGRLGVKAGKGFRDYSGQDMEQIIGKRNNKIVQMLKAIKELDS